MAFKIEKINNSLVVTDTTASEELIDTPTRLVYYDLDVIKETPARIQLKHIDDKQTVARRLRSFLLSECIDTGDVAYTVSSWKTFARTNLG